jgi:hypothetical protein
MRPCCVTCKSWDQRYPENKNLGVCRRMGVINIGSDAAVNVRQYIDLSEPTSDFQAVRVLDTFGCREHSDYL